MSDNVHFNNKCRHQASFNLHIYLELKKKLKIRSLDKWNTLLYTSRPGLEAGQMLPGFGELALPLRTEIKNRVRESDSDKVKERE